MLRTVGAFIGTCAVALIVANSAAAETIVHQINVPFPETALNACNGDVVVVNGTFDLLLAITPNPPEPTGSFHTKFHGASKGEGLGSLTNARYVFSEEFDSELNAAGAVTVTQISDHHLTSVGSTDNFVLRIVIRLTINANGVPTVNTVETETFCRG